MTPAPRPAPHQHVADGEKTLDFRWHGQVMGGEGTTWGGDGHGAGGGRGNLVRPVT